MVSPATATGLSLSNIYAPRTLDKVRFEFLQTSPDGVKVRWQGLNKTLGALGPLFVGTILELGLVGVTRD